MRIFRMVATPILLVGLLAVLVWGASWGWRNLTAPIPEPEPTPCVTLETDVITKSDIHLRVLNGGFTSGLAYRTAQHLQELQFNIVQTGNTDERIKATIIRGNADDQAVLEMVATYFVDAQVETDERIEGIIDVLVGSEFAGYAQGNRIPEVTPSSGTMCLPPEAAAEEKANRASSPTPASPTPTSEG